MPGIGVGLGVEDDEVGFTGVGDVVLAAADAPAAVFPHGAGAHVGGVGTGGRFGQAEGAQQLAGGGAGQPFLALFFGAADEDGVGGEEVRGQGRRRGGACRCDRFDHTTHGEAADAETTVGLRQVDAHEAQVAQGLQAISAECFGFVVALRVGLEHVAGDPLGGLDNGQFSGIELKVHGYLRDGSGQRGHSLRQGAGRAPRQGVCCR
ncbi:hypothetical protein D3C80_687320 [compost metagenome]